MISMICSRNLTDPNVIKGFYHLITHPPSPTPYFLKPHLASSIPPASHSVVPPPGPPDTPPSPSFVCLFVCTCVLPDAEPNSVALVALTVTVWVRFFFFFFNALYSTSLHKTSTHPSLNHVKTTLSPNESMEMSRWKCLDVSDVRTAQTF